MKRPLLKSNLICLFLLLATSLNAQWQNGLWTEKQAYNWYFGNTGLTFSSTPPTPLFDSNNQFNANEGSGVISDAEGNLLFYTDGGVVYNRNHGVMLNGSGLVGNNSSSQTGLVIPAPGDNPDLYYVFHQTDDVGVIAVPETAGLYYSEVDMSLDMGLGGVTNNKNIRLSSKSAEKLTAVYHQDKKQVWVIRHSGGENNPSNEIISILISEDGVSAPPLAPVTSNVGEVLVRSYGQMKVSPDGSKLAIVSSLFSPQRSLQVFDFNNSTGEVTNPISLEGVMATMAYGLEFSPNSQYLYVTDVGGFTLPKIHQFDLKAGSEADILASGVNLIPDGSLSLLFSLQLAPDGKIYIANGIGEHISVINYPNNKGIAADLDYGAIPVSDDVNIYKNAGLGLPGFIQSYFESGILYEGGICSGQDITFSTIRISGIESIVWNFGDPESGANNTSTDIIPTHAFSNPGVYTVTAVITSNGAEQTATTQITITAPDAVVPEIGSLTLCAESTGTATFNLTDLTFEILNGQDPAIFTVNYYATTADVEIDNQIDTPESFTTNGQSVFAKVTDAETGCSKVIDFALVVNPFLQTTVPVVSPQCANNEGIAVFDLTEQESVIMEGQNPDDFTIMFFSNEADIEANNPINTPGNFTTAGQTVYARVTDTTTGCEAVVAFDLIVIPLPVVDNFEDVSACGSYELPVLRQGNSYWTGSEATGVELLAGYKVTESTIIYIHAKSPDNPACTSETTFEVTINTFDFNSVSGCENSRYMLEVIPVDDSFNTDTATYLWSGPNFTSSERKFEVPVIGTYNVTVITEDGCAAQKSFIVDTILCEIPRGISPNGDGDNDTFDLSGYGVIRLSIFNRYGVEVYNQTNYNNEWSGQSTNGNELPTGTYYYMIELKNGETKTGWVYINRNI